MDTGKTYDLGAVAVQVTQHGPDWGTNTRSPSHHARSYGPDIFVTFLTCSLLDAPFCLTPGISPAWGTYTHSVAVGLNAVAAACMGPIMALNPSNSSCRLLLTLSLWQLLVLSISKPWMYPDAAITDACGSVWWQGCWDSCLWLTT